MRPVLLPAVSLLFALVLASCSGSQVKKAERWAPYPGCNAAQCKSWYEECSAECVNDQSAGVTECENKCRANIASCESSCAG